MFSNMIIDTLATQVLPSSFLSRPVPQIQARKRVLP